MDAKTIIENRFQSQKLIQTAWSDSPERIVFHFGAMQSQTMVSRSGLLGVE